MDNVGRREILSPSFVDERFEKEETLNYRPRTLIVTNVTIVVSDATMSYRWTLIVSNATFKVSGEL